MLAATKISYKFPQAIKNYEDCSLLIIYINRHLTLVCQPPKALVTQRARKKPLDFDSAAVCLRKGLLQQSSLTAMAVTFPMDNSMAAAAAGVPPKEPMNVMSVVGRALTYTQTIVKNKGQGEGSVETKNPLL